MNETERKELIEEIIEMLYQLGMIRDDDAKAGDSE